MHATRSKAKAQRRQAKENIKTKKNGKTSNPNYRY